MCKTAYTLAHPARASARIYLRRRSDAVGLFLAGLGRAFGMFRRIDGDPRQARRRDTQFEFRDIHSDGFRAASYLFRRQHGAAMAAVEFDFRAQFAFFWGFPRWRRARPGFTIFARSSSARPPRSPRSISSASFLSRCSALHFWANGSARPIGSGSRSCRWARSWWPINFKAPALAKELTSQKTP